jgi:hypothetical protein
MAYPGRVVGYLLAHPVDGFERLRGWRERGRDIRARESGPRAAEPSADWDQRFHRALGLDVPCDVSGEFAAVWDELERSLEASGLPVGEGLDADRNFARAVWCAVCHLEPTRVVETGVARGITTTFLLSALDRRRDGRLWSIDLPPLGRGWSRQWAAAVPDRLRERWIPLQGSSRRVLPGLLRDLGRIDLFVHDSDHTTATMRFELQTAWPHLNERGVLLAGGTESNGAFARFSDTSGVVALAAPNSRNDGTFGIVVKEPVNDRERLGEAKERSSA